MSFAIEVLPDQVPQSVARGTARWGLITIASFQERFVVPLHYWKASDYEQHWQQAVSRLLTQSDKSCLVTSMNDPQIANFIIWWPMYRVGDVAFIQNQILFMDTLSTPFDPNIPFAHVRERSIVGEDGEKLSEWQVPVEDLVGFLKEY